MEPNMALPPSSSPDSPQPIRNLRITFWGVQGSCTAAPTRADVDEYARRIATATLDRALNDIASRVERGEGTPAALRELASPAALESYQRQLGMPQLPTFGGDTTCIEVETSAGDTLLFDMGSGVRAFSRNAVANWGGQRPRTLHVFLTHEHLDHRRGLPFASVCFERTNPFTINMYGTHRTLAALDDRYGIFSKTLGPTVHYDDPLDYRSMSAAFAGTEIRGSEDASARPVAPSSWRVHDLKEPIHVGATTVTPFEVYHAATRCLGYHVRQGDATFVFCTDHELRHGEDSADPRQLRSHQAEDRLIDHCRNADVGYFDGQYMLAEYKGLQGIGGGAARRRVDWGHGCMEDVIERARACQVRRAYIGHHEPERPWAERFKIDTDLRALSHGKQFHIELAKAGTVIDV
jgi:hypothetical protein